MKLSVVMPVYNEQATLPEAIARVLAVPMEIELICVDDGSTDGSREILAELQAQHPQMQVLLQPRNLGKGAALRRGIQQATGDFVIIQDADLNTTPPSTPRCWGHSSRAKLTWSMAHASWAPGRIACSISRTRWGTGF
jgi:glycosyltransferase involved in cell wall biosynthesis